MESNLLSLRLRLPGLTTGLSMNWHTYTGRWVVLAISGKVGLDLTQTYGAAS